MDSEKLMKYGPLVLQQVADYWSTLREKRVPKPDVKPGFVMSKFPPNPPEQPEAWEDILADVESHILAGNTHWHHPHFFAYFPAACSYPAVLADILASGMACIGFSWNSSPSCTEVEVVMLDWLVKALGLPDHFLFSHEGSGGGIIQTTASESTLVAVLGARGQILRRRETEKMADAKVNGNASTNHARNDKTDQLRTWFSSMSSKLNNVLDTVVPKLSASRLMMYCSTEAHCSVERAALLANVNLRKVNPDDNLSLRGAAVAKAIDEDRRRGWIPFCIIATIGSTNTCAFDNLRELGVLAQDRGLWLHVDAAYAGSACVCPEFRYIIDGVELADSFNFNPHKWLMINFDCSPMWFKDKSKVEAGFRVDPLYLKHENEGDMPDFRHMQIALGRRFRSLKIWFVLRAYGVEGLRDHIRQMVILAKEFEQLIVDDPDQLFTVTAPVVLGLVCFRLKDQPNERSELLTKRINEDGRIHLVPSSTQGIYFLRLAICSSETTSEDVRFAFSVIKECYATMN